MGTNRRRAVENLRVLFWMLVASAAVVGFTSYVLIGFLLEALS